MSVLIYTGVLEKLYFYAGYTVGNAIWIVMAVILSFVLALPVFYDLTQFLEKKLMAGQTQKLRDFSRSASFQ